MALAAEERIKKADAKTGTRHQQNSNGSRSPKPCRIHFKTKNNTQCYRRPTIPSRIRNVLSVIDHLSYFSLYNVSILPRKKYTFFGLSLFPSGVSSHILPKQHGYTQQKGQ